MSLFFSVSTPNTLVIDRETKTYLGFFSVSENVRRSFVPHVT